MIFGSDRDELRRGWIDAWQKRLDGLPLSPFDAQIVAVIELHPEYHTLLTRDALAAEFTVEGGQSNPFLHMGLHLGIREQVSTARPAAIVGVYETLCRRFGDVHAAEHRMIDCLAETLWEAQSQMQAPDEKKYVERLSRLLET